ncbi:unnamed protein product [Camellia sinensis]
MLKREAVEAAHQKCMQMPRIIHLREAAATGANGERSGDHMEIPNLEAQKQLDQVDSHDNCWLGLSEKSWQFWIITI